ncbi:hypothetical protein MPTK1_1g18770 [Marchantia polymorpha subsp. ruderalis]|uniref:rRNA-processing protein FYV7 n=2 Tax=Marchantia polymorpha TaxID=3197 RepID=A0AAF6ARN8_MARPO|nr:hypothetical protein MARPO_0001s0215 [Marchantia polymorpha]BBM99108.1 hypothetical protein Mp_1g18770 [Marchantia polymorpha subsp. ruderalis]|eukprot:PTQ50185.1 hypothetical protein MARPO_0001s0215 [Marchantia polymorpha]
MKGRGKPRNVDGDRARGPGLSKFKPQQRAKKKLGGGGLSLEAFVGAKSKPAINPAQIREHREFYQNAKKVNQYKKIVKQLNEQGQVSGAETREQVRDEVRDAVEGSRAPKKAGAIRKPLFIKGNQSLQFKMQRKIEKRQREERGPTQLEKLSEEVQSKKQEEERERREREEQFSREKDAREKAKRQRKEAQNKMRKKTGRGQPVMKHRMQHLLETLQRE